MKTLFVFVVCLLLTMQMFAQTFNARLTTSLYNWQYQSYQADGSVLESDHLRLHQGLHFKFNRISGKNISLNGYVSASGDLMSSPANDPNYRMYHLYLTARDVTPGLNLKIGRQRVFAGVGWGTFDGLSVSYSNWKPLRADVYVGIQAPLNNSDFIGKWDTDKIYGFRLRPQEFYGFRSSVSFVNREREITNYVQPGQWSGRIVENSTTQRRLLGLDVRRTSFGVWDTYARVDFALQERITSPDLNRFEFLNTVRVNKNLSLGLDYIFREPIIDINTIFWVFDYQPSTEIGGRASYLFGNGLRLSANYANVDYEGDSSTRFTASGSFGPIFLSYTNNAGYSGNLDGFSAGYNYSLSPAFALTAQSAYSWYEFEGNKDSRHNALTFLLGSNWKAAKNMMVNIQGQYLNNIQLKNDYRFFAKYSYWFSTSL